MTTIDVQVSGGTAPIPIKVVIDNINNNDDRSFKREKSFTETHDLPPGEYMITISGMNPPNGKTKMEVSGQFKVGPEPSSVQVSEKRLYSKFFYVAV